MTRLGVIFWLVLVLAAGFTTFKVKYAVQDIEDQLNRVRRQTIVEHQEIRVLTAEWTFLTQPERLAELNRRFLGLGPLAAKQLQRTVGDIPLRAQPAPPAEAPDVLVPAVLAPDVLMRANAESAASASPAAAPTAATAPLPDMAPTAAEALAAARATLSPTGLSPAAARPAVHVQLAKAAPGRTPGSLDALIAQIADRR